MKNELRRIKKVNQKKRDLQGNTNKKNKIKRQIQFIQKLEMRWSK